MRLSLICCFLLATAMDVLSISRQKRDLWSIKSLISSKLFGTETIVVQIPKIPKNETFQLFKIKGYDDILLKVVRKSEKQKNNEKPAIAKLKDPVMVSPEIAIIGNYLGTSTHEETLLALEIAKNLLKTGILGSERVVPIRERVNIISSERAPMYIVPDSANKIELVNTQPVPVYPERQHPVLVTEIKYQPQMKYSYKQEFENADMKYESYNMKDVIVTRTDKVPDKPTYVAVRLAEVVSIADNPYLIRSHQPVRLITAEQSVVQPFLKKVPAKISNYEDLKSFVSSNVDNNVPSFITQSKQPFDIRDHLSDNEINKLNQYINEKLNNKRRNGPPSLNDENVSSKNKDMNQNHIQVAAMYEDTAAKYGNMVHRYVYHQMGDDNQNNYTFIGIEDPKLNQTKFNIIQSNDEISKDYVYMPPKNVDIPPPNLSNLNTFKNEYLSSYSSSLALSISSNKGNIHFTSPALAESEKETDTHVNLPAQFRPNNKVQDYSASLHAIGSNKLHLTTSAPNDPNDNLENLGLHAVDVNKQNTEQSSGTTAALKTNVQNSLRQNPIVVADIEQSRGKVKTFRPSFKPSTARPYTGGPVF